MKKCILIFTIIAITATGAFAQISFSAGGGALIDMSFNNGIKYEDFYMGFRNISFGPYLFFDATYVEAALTLGFGSLTWVVSDGKESDSDKFGNIQQFGFTVLGKYPVDMGSITVFPLLGISYNMVLAGKYDGGTKMENASELNQFGLLAGGGLDYDLNSNLYLRGQVMLQMRFPSKTMSDEAEGDVSATLGFGPVIRIGIGYRF